MFKPMWKVLLKTLQRLVCLWNKPRKRQNIVDDKQHEDFHEEEDKKQEQAEKEKQQQESKKDEDKPSKVLLTQQYCLEL